MVQICYKVNKLTMDTLRRVPGGRHNKRTSSFIRACVAFCIITIPSIENIITRLTLYLNTAQVALMNGSTAQADSLFDSLTKTIKEVPPIMQETNAATATSKTKPIDSWIVSFSANLFTALLLMPDYPSQGILFHFKNAINEFASYPFSQDSLAKLSIYNNVLRALNVFAQKEWPLRLSLVDNNGDLYGKGADKKYQSEMAKIGRHVLTEMNSELDSMAANAAGQVPLGVTCDYIRTLLYSCPGSAPFVLKICERYIPSIASRCGIKERVSMAKTLLYACEQLQHEETLSSAQVEKLDASYRKLIAAFN